MAKIEQHPVAFGNFLPNIRPRARCSRGKGHFHLEDPTLRFGDDFNIAAWT